MPYKRFVRKAVTKKRYARRRYSKRRYGAGFTKAVERVMQKEAEKKVFVIDNDDEPITLTGMGIDDWYFNLVIFNPSNTTPPSKGVDSDEYVGTQINISRI